MPNFDDYPHAGSLYDSVTAGGGLESTVDDSHVRDESAPKSSTSWTEKEVPLVDPAVPTPAEAANGTEDDVDLLYTPFSPAWKKAVVGITGVTGMLAPFSSNIFLPAISNVATDLDSTVSRINVAVSVFMIGLGVAPILWGPIADQFGRRYPYALGCLVCALASVGCALAKSDSLLLGMRFLQAFGGSSTIVLGAGSISDIFEPAQRGSALGIFFSAQMLGPILGTIIGGYVADSLGWRWCFWLTAIISGVFCIVLTFVLPETHRPTVARRRQMPLKGLPRDTHLRPRPPITWAQVNPFSIAPTLQFKYVWMPTVCTAIMFACFYSVNTAVATILAKQYHYSISRIGLCYITIGAGCIIGALVGGIMADRNFRRQSLRRQAAKAQQPSEADKDAEAFDPTAPRVSGKAANVQSPPAANSPYEARILFVIFTMTLFPLAMIAWGWCMNFTTSIVFPLICQVIIGFCLNASFGGISTYLVDLFTIRSSSITSLANLFRCLYTALWTGIIEIVIDSWGVGWAFTFLGFMSMVGAVLTFIVYKHGEAWRTEKPPTAYMQLK
ncbi:hypothetical protein IWQ60_001031 [Tieghemiomyces parasiticus]|uniref:Major facilitator superfamily (MFS) profile domain-containing protein n=1 Tax=Tieghemiomyces parasiticus TaxID=78921 RepID=A0A9W8AER7_9FUNG|nr:hypothetical protein IWQ60_001031 [Tieghemiomyces parasiticus]